jgi:hypothetical protein
MSQFTRRQNDKSSISGNTDNRSTTLVALWISCVKPVARRIWSMGHRYFRGWRNIRFHNLQTGTPKRAGSGRRSFLPAQRRYRLDDMREHCVMAKSESSRAGSHVHDGISLWPGFRMMALTPRTRSLSTADCDNTAYR